ncbi:unnamed protein product, partial [Larinioides sclopetarius]
MQQHPFKVTSVMTDFLQLLAEVKEKTPSFPETPQFRRCRKYLYKQKHQWQLFVRESRFIW